MKSTCNKRRDYSNINGKFADQVKVESRWPMEKFFHFLLEQVNEFGLDLELISGIIDCLNIFQ